MIDPVGPTLPGWRTELEKIEKVCPWPGPRPLRESDQALLSGRDDDCLQFRQEVDSHRLVLLTGASGVGKTSLLRAGLVPALRASGYVVAVCRDWTGSAQEIDSLEFLARVVSRELAEIKITDLPNDGSLFWELEQRFGERVVLVLDQFEELIRDARDFKDDLYEVLADINHRTSTKVVISFRSEYLHELRALETKARPFTISHYYLEEVNPLYARQLVEAGNSEARRAIDDEAVDKVVKGWTDALLQRSTTAGGRERVGLLHLQALLYSLEEAADHKTITASTIKTFRREIGARRSETANLFWGALRAAVEVKLDRCRMASAAVGLDRYLVEGTAQVLARSVRHLSSAGYKLVRDSWELAETTMGAELNSLRDGLALTQADEDEPPDGPVTHEQVRALFDALVGTIQYQDHVADPASAGLGEAERAPAIDLLATDRRSIAGSADAALADPDARAWVKRLHPGGPPLSVDRIPVTCGPMLGMAPAAVLIEELRRFAFALEWLQASSLVRLNTPVTGGAMVALIHDGFGAALERWSRETARKPSGALHALTAPKAAEFDWSAIARPVDDDDPDPGPQRVEDPVVQEVLAELGLGDRFLPQLDGAPQNGATARPDHQLEVPPAKLLVNLRWRGALVHAAFRRVAFVNCDLRGSIFRRSVFDGATFINCLLDGVIFDRCVILGALAPASREWSDDPQTYRLPVTDVTPSVIARYRGLTITEPGLFSQLPGLPALPCQAAATSVKLGVQPGGLAVYGGRVSSLVMRGCRFRDDAVFRLRDAAGSGLDVVEIREGGAYEIVGSSLRHITFTSASTGGRPEREPVLSIKVAVSKVAQLWIGDDLSGRLDIDNSKLVHVLNGSTNLVACARNSPYHGLVNVETDDDCHPLVEGERPVDLAVVDRDNAITGMSRGMDYQENPAVRSWKADDLRALEGTS